MTPRPWFMDTQLVYINKANGVVSTLNTSRLSPNPTATLGTLLNLHAGFHENGSVVELPGGTTGRMAVKVQGQIDGNVVLLATSWMKVGEGTSTRYALSVLADSVQLRAALEGHDQLDFVSQIQWDVVGETEPRRSRPFKLTIFNSTLRDEDGAPDIEETLADQWLDDRAVRYDVDQALTDAEASRALANLNVIFTAGGYLQLTDAAGNTWHIPLNAGVAPA